MRQAFRLFQYSGAPIHVQPDAHRVLEARERLEASLTIATCDYPPWLPRTGRRAAGLVKCAVRPLAERRPAPLCCRTAGKGRRHRPEGNCAGPRLPADPSAATEAYAADRSVLPVHLRNRPYQALLAQGRHIEAVLAPPGSRGAGWVRPLRNVPGGGGLTPRRLPRPQPRPRTATDDRKAGLRPPTEPRPGWCQGWNGDTGGDDGANGTDR